VGLVKLAGVTHCPKGHDLTLPNAVRWFKSRTKDHGECRTCANERNRKRLNNVVGAFKTCQGCGKPKPETGWRFCSHACHKASGEIQRDPSVDNTLRILSLGKKLETAMPWERDGIKAQIAELMQGAAE
jgi:hypothetical protein